MTDTTPVTRRRMTLPSSLADLAAAPGGADLAHDLVGLPEFEVDFLADLAERAPAAWVCARSVQHDPHEPRGGVALLPDAVGVLRGEADHTAYVDLANVEHLVEYLELSRELDCEVRALVGSAEGGLDRVNLGILAAPPGSVVPAHPDQHHNLLLQIVGTKTVWIENEPDRTAHERRVAAHYECSTVPTTELPPATAHVQRAGDGVYIAPDTFHWTQVGDDGWSVALSIGFATPRSHAVVDARRFDDALRRRGLPVRAAAFPGRRTTKVRAQLARVGRPDRRSR